MIYTYRVEDGRQYCRGDGALLVVSDGGGHDISFFAANKVGLDAARALCDELNSEEAQKKVH